MYRYYYCPCTASMAPHSVLEEIGADYEGVKIDISDTPEGYEAKHPLRRVPVLEDGAFTLFESAAIMMHLCDRHPEAGLAPLVGDPMRALFYQWLVFFPAHLHASTKFFNYPHRYTTDAAGIPAVQAKAVETVDGIFRVLDGRMGDGPWLLGERYSACDHALHMYCTWIEVDLVGLERLSTYPNLARFVDRARERPGIQRMMKIHGLG
jgi:glutathione S-transferase